MYEENSQEPLRPTDESLVLSEISSKISMLAQLNVLLEMQSKAILDSVDNDGEEHVCLYGFRKLEGSDDYSSWRALMRLCLIQLDRWNIVNGDDNTDSPEDLKKREREAYNYIIIALSSDVLADVAESHCGDSGRSLWRFLEQKYRPEIVDSILVKQTRLLRMLLIAMSKDANPLDHTNKFLTIANELDDSDPCLQKFTIQAFLISLPSEYDHFINSLPTDYLNTPSASQLDICKRFLDYVS
ncbi:hypothetical protein V1511DRAFT_504948 [Dipodascopsis uninucleata]